MNMEKAISNISSVLGIIAVIGTIVSAFLGETVAAFVLIGLTILFWLVWLTLKTLNLSSQIQRLTSQHQAPAEVTVSSNVKIEKFMDDSPWISHSRKNNLKIGSKFLMWDECTILLHVLVSKQGSGVRYAPRNKYIIGHHQYEFSEKKDINVFGLRYSSRNKWELTTSNNSGDSLPHDLVIDDGLEEGWHQFMIAWNRNEPELKFLINRGRRGGDISSSFLNYWPQVLSDSVSIGAWPSAYSHSFVETKLAHLWICDKYLAPDDPLVIKHQKLMK